MVKGRRTRRPWTLAVAAAVAFVWPSEAAVRVGQVRAAGQSGAGLGAVGAAFVQAPLSPLALPSLRTAGLEPAPQTATLNFPAVSLPETAFALAPAAAAGPGAASQALPAAGKHSASAAEPPAAGAGTGAAVLVGAASPSTDSNIAVARPREAQTGRAPAVRSGLDFAGISAQNAARLFDQAAQSRSGGDAVAGSLGAHSPLLSRDGKKFPGDPDFQTPAPQAAVVEIPAATAGTRLRDSFQYAMVTLSSLYWYTFPRLFERWDELKEQIDAADGKETAVTGFVNFFIAHRVQGSTGNYAPMGFRVAANRLVVRDAWAIFNNYFHPDEAARDAFRNFVERAKKFNPNRRSTQFRKILFHALRAGSVMSVKELPDFFDSLATESEGRRLLEYQETKQAGVLAAFKRTAEEAILEINRGLRPGKRVVGALLLGSFANGAAGPASDLDVQTITEDGSPAHTAKFNDLLKKKWKAQNYPDHPFGGFQYALPLSKSLLTRVHPEPYIILSPYPEVVAAMSRNADEDAAARQGSSRSFRGYLFQLAYTHLLLFVLAGYGVYKWLKNLSR